MDRVAPTLSDGDDRLRISPILPPQSSGTEKRLAGPPPQPTMPAIRQAILDLFMRPPHRCLRRGVNFRAWSGPRPAQAQAILAAKGYDADHLGDRIEQAGTDVVIPPERNRRTRRSYDSELCKERNRAVSFFARLKQFRRAATRYDKLPGNFTAFVKLAAIAIWLR